ncbi:MAG: hypothetical protein AABY15_07755 [Nanoarchaeota archaeon]
MKENMIVWIGIIVLVVLLFGGFGGMMGFGNSGYGMMGYNYGGMWLFGGLFMILVVVALVLLIAWLVKELQKK